MRSRSYQCQGHSKSNCKCWQVGGGPLTERHSCSKRVLPCCVAGKCVCDGNLKLCKCDVNACASGATGKPIPLTKLSQGVVWHTKYAGYSLAMIFVC